MVVFLLFTLFHFALVKKIMAQNIKRTDDLQSNDETQEFICGKVYIYLALELLLKYDFGYRILNWISLAFKLSKLDIFEPRPFSNVGRLYMYFFRK